MYQYTTEGLGECDVMKQRTTLGPGIDPKGAQNKMCPLLQDSMTGRFLDYQVYTDRSLNPKDRLSRFKKFRDEDCYKDYLKRFCRESATVQPTLQPWSPPEWIEEFKRLVIRLLSIAQTPAPPTQKNP